MTRNEALAVVARKKELWADTNRTDLFTELEQAAFALAEAINQAQPAG